MRINAVLDRIVDKASRMERSGRGISFYEMAHLTGKILAAALIAWIAVWSGDPRMWRFYLV